MKTKINKSMRAASLLLMSLLLLSLLPFSISAETVYSEGYFKYTISGDEAAIIEYFGSESEIVIPSSLGGRTVTELRGRIFRSDLPVTKLTLPDTLTARGGFCCPSLERRGPYHPAGDSVVAAGGQDGPSGGGAGHRYRLAAGKSVLGRNQRGRAAPPQEETAYQQGRAA